MFFWGAEAVRQQSKRRVPLQICPSTSSGSVSAQDGILPTFRIRLVRKMRHDIRSEKLKRLEIIFVRAHDEKL